MADDPTVVESSAIGGEGGIRTRDTRKGKPAFQASAIGQLGDLSKIIPRYQFGFYQVFRYEQHEQIVAKIASIDVWIPIP